MVAHPATKADGDRDPGCAREPRHCPSPARKIAEPESLPRDDERPRGDSLFSWPVEGEVTSGFGPRNGSFHDGVDIAAPRGTAVLAAGAGQVIFSDTLRGYGNVV